MRAMKRHHRMLAAPNHYSFGSTAAIVTSVGLIVGFGAASVSRAAMVSGLLIIAVADNLTDSLSIHIYQESENIDGRVAFFATLTNYVARLVVALSFVAIVIALPLPIVPGVALAWGFLLLSTLTFLLARLRHVSVRREILKHLSVATAAVVTGRAIGAFIAAHVR
jgi:hypothetical protein